MLHPSAFVRRASSFSIFCFMKLFQIDVLCLFVRCSIKSSKMNERIQLAFRADEDDV